MYVCVTSKKTARDKGKIQNVKESRELLLPQRELGLVTDANTRLLLGVINIGLIFSVTIPFKGSKARGNTDKGRIFQSLQTEDMEDCNYWLKVSDQH